MHKSKLRPHALDFIEHLRTKGHRHDVGMTEAQEVYVRWCHVSGLQPLKKWHLGQQLIAAGCQRQHNSDGSARYVLPTANRKVA